MFSSGGDGGCEDGSGDRQRNGTPGNNQAQNKQITDIVRDLKLNPDQRKTLHRFISKENMGYREIKELAQDIKEGLR